MKGIKANRFFRISDVYAHYGWKLQRDHQVFLDWIEDVIIVLGYYEQIRRGMEAHQ
jgi:hypothetical protein